MRTPAQSEIAQLIGTPFAYGARGPEAYDCYGLVMHLHALQGIKLPDYRSPTEQARICSVMALALQLWEECSSSPGAVVTFKIGRLISHCGVVLDDDRFIHTWEGSGGVCIERLTDWTTRIHSFVRYVGPR